MVRRTRRQPRRRRPPAEVSRENVKGTIPVRFAARDELYNPRWEIHRVGVANTQNTLCFWPASKYTANTQPNTQWRWWLADQGVTCTNVQVPTRNTKKLNYLSSSDRLPRSNIGQICEKSMKPHEKRQIFLRLRRAGRIYWSRCSVYPGFVGGNTQNTLCFQPKSKYTKYRLPI